MADTNTNTALYYYVPTCDHHLIETFFNTEPKPTGYADNAAEFAASFTNWTIRISQKESRKPSQVAIRKVFRKSFPDMSAADYITAITVFGREYRYERKFTVGVIKDFQSLKEVAIARAELFGCLYTKDEKVALSTMFPEIFPLRSVDWVAQQWGGLAGMSLRTIEGGDSDMAQSIEGFSLSREGLEASRRDAEIRRKVDQEMRELDDDRRKAYMLVKMTAVLGAKDEPTLLMYIAQEALKLAGIDF
ncbi:hypothetical protein LTR56_000146 [Elasticomyces elasticus]|nr:hypothetical protein LTR56_000146 [Elasticomyces elasticus]KAK3667134.1 hypothetical protein LTR22_001998 [Elasticomyces elasticus]KAK4932909.1 hypothetical protein LTR49_000865 [Elasticomyces elasticus]KAK5768687.1 hypothetical protein LTS12_001113 [Elasticomyces elasticus]